MSLFSFLLSDLTTMAGVAAGDLNLTLTLAAAAAAGWCRRPTYRVRVHFRSHYRTTVILYSSSSTPRVEASREEGTYELMFSSFQKKKKNGKNSPR